MPTRGKLFTGEDAQRTPPGPFLCKDTPVLSCNGFYAITGNPGIVGGGQSLLTNGKSNLIKKVFLLISAQTNRFFICAKQPKPRSCSQPTICLIYSLPDLKKYVKIPTTAIPAPTTKLDWIALKIPPVSTANSPCPNTVVKTAPANPTESSTSHLV